MRYSAALNLTTYIISHKEGDSSIRVLSSILDTTIETARPPQRTNIFLRDPFDIAVILSTLSFEASKFHAARFRRFMWEQINKVDDHLAGLSDSDRRNLSNLTKQLQIISQNADSHLGNADVAIITASAIRTVHGHLHKAIGSPIQIHERAADSINYVIESVQKQKIWFLNYKARKDSTMALVYNLVTQQDAASNIQIAASMKRDSTSMNAIAALTMVFLPGTFTAVRLPTLLSFFFPCFLSIVCLRNGADCTLAADPPRHRNLLRKGKQSPHPRLGPLVAMDCSHSSPHTNRDCVLVDIQETKGQGANWSERQRQ
jgi:hypothetical protein